MGITSEVRDGKLYVLCFEELAHFLVYNSRYKVLFCPYDLPAIVVTHQNYDWCINQNDYKFVYELELPLLEIVSSQNHNGLGLTINSNSRYASFLGGVSFDEADIWREKEIEKRLKKLGSYQQLEKVREEVDQLIKTLPI